MTISSLGLLFGLTFSLTIFQLALARVPLWLLRGSSGGRRLRTAAAHLMVGVTLLTLLVYADAAPQIVTWLAIVLAMAIGTAIDFAMLRLRRRRVVLATA